MIANGIVFAAFAYGIYALVICCGRYRIETTTTTEEES